MASRKQHKLPRTQTEEAPHSVPPIKKNSEQECRLPEELSLGTVGTGTKCDANAKTRIGNYLGAHLGGKQYQPAAVESPTGCTWVS